MITKDSVNDNISSNQMMILQSPKVIATLTIMIITLTTTIIITAKIRTINCIINSIDFTKIGHQFVLYSKSAPVMHSVFGVLPCAHVACIGYFLI